jgi:hypothetical protein
MSVAKAGFVFSVRAGSGVVIAKLPDGSWSAPSAVGTAGGGAGFQVGVEVAEFLIILNSRKAVKSFMAKGSLTLYVPPSFPPACSRFRVRPVLFYRLLTLLPHLTAAGICPLPPVHSVATSKAPVPYRAKEQQRCTATRGQKVFSAVRVSRARSSSSVRMRTARRTATSG